jgi:hypothetical protein
VSAAAPRSAASSATEWARRWSLTRRRAPPRAGPTRSSSRVSCANPDAGRRDPGPGLEHGDVRVLKRSGASSCRASRRPSRPASWRERAWEFEAARRRRLGQAHGSAPERGRFGRCRITTPSGTRLEQLGADATARGRSSRRARPSTLRTALWARYRELKPTSAAQRIHNILRATHVGPAGPITIPFLDIELPSM